MNLKASEETNLMQCLFGIDLPEYLLDFFSRKPGIHLRGASEDQSSDSLWGATSLLRSARPDLPEYYIAILFLGSNSVCLDLSRDNGIDAPLVTIILSGSERPQESGISFKKFIERIEQGMDCFSALGYDTQRTEQLWFARGLERLNWHMDNLSFRYNHSNGGQLPRSHLWRPLRFCVQDVILGIAVIRHDSRLNRLEVDVFLTASIPEYEEDSGCRALTLILLSDAYKSGGSMEIKFSEQIEGGRIPAELVNLADSLGVALKHAPEGGITPSEAKHIFLGLSGFSEMIQKRILDLESAGTVSSASICYAMHHGVWSAAEIETIILASRFPGSILRGEYFEESWHLFQHDLYIGRTALMGGFLDRKLASREHIIPASESDASSHSVVEMEDDERFLDISFDSEHFAKIYLLKDDAPVDIPWLSVVQDNDRLNPDQKLMVLLRARNTLDMIECMPLDIDLAISLKRNHPDILVYVMVPADFHRIDLALEVEKASKAGVGIIVCPEFVHQMDSEVRVRMESLRIMRQ